MFEATLLQHPWIHIILEMAVVEWQTDAIESLTGKEFRICLCEEVFQEFVKKELIFLFTKNLQHGSTVLAFVPRVSCYEVLHAVIFLAMQNE
jgi:hypothetical protein